MVRDSIDLMVKDIISNTKKNIIKFKIHKLNDVYNSKEKIVCFSDKFLIIEKEIKQFLRIKMYNNQRVLNKNNKGKKIIKYLFKSISKNPRKFLNQKKINNSDKFRSISDYISGMTDRYAINLYNSIK